MCVRVVAEPEHRTRVNRDRRSVDHRRRVVHRCRSAVNHRRCIHWRPVGWRRVHRCRRIRCRRRGVIDRGRIIRWGVITRPRRDPGKPIPTENLTPAFATAGSTIAASPAIHESFIKISLWALPCPRDRQTNPVVVSTENTCPACPTGHVGNGRSLMPDGLESALNPKTALQTRSRMSSDGLGAMTLQMSGGHRGDSQSFSAYCARNCGTG